jgi:hypothetical protein
MRFVKMSTLLFLAGVSIPAAAGLVQPITTTVNLQEGWAVGAIGQGNHNGANSIGCSVTSIPGTHPSGVNVQCSGSDAAGNRFECASNSVSTVVPDVTKNIRAINSASFIAVYWDPAAPISCRDIRLIQGSQFLPDMRGVQMYNERVRIDTGFADAVLGKVRYNPNNPEEFLSCDVWASGYIFCMARATGGVEVKCDTTEAANPGFADAVRSIDAASWVHFYFDRKVVGLNPAAFACTTIKVDKYPGFVPF